MKKITIMLAAVMAITTLVGCADANTTSSVDRDTSSITDSVIDNNKTDVTSDVDIDDIDIDDADTSVTESETDDSSAEEITYVVPPIEDFEFFRSNGFLEDSYEKYHPTAKTQILEYGPDVVIMCEYEGTETHIVYPYEINGEPIVTGWSGQTVWNNNLIGIKFADGTTKIPDYAINGADNLETVIIPDTVTEIGTLAIAYCGKVETITIPDSVVKIGEDALLGLGNERKDTFTATYRGKTYGYDEKEQLYADINANSAE